MVRSCVLQAFIIDWGLPYPSARAAGVLIKSMHAKGGEVNVKRQLKSLGASFLVAFFWDFFQWFFAGEPPYPMRFLHTLSAFSEKFLGTLRSQSD